MTPGPNIGNIFPMDDIDSYRRDYRKIRSQAKKRFGMSPLDFDKRCHQYLRYETWSPDPINWPRVARKVLEDLWLESEVEF